MRTWLQLGGKLTARINRSPMLRILVIGRLLGPMGILIITLLLNLTLVFMLFFDIGNQQKTGGFLILVSLAALVAGLIGAGRLHSQLLKPLVELEQSVADVCEGVPWSNLPLKSVGVLGPVTRDLDSLSGELIDIYEDMDDRVARLTRRLAQKTASLQILYDVAASINQMSDMDELLLRLLQVIKKMLHADAVIVQRYTADGQVRLVGSIGEDSRLLNAKAQLPIPLCRCGRVLTTGDILCNQNPKVCASRIGRKMYSSSEMEIVTIPIHYHGDILGRYHICLHRPGTAGREELLELFSTIGNHLGIAIAKQRSDEEANRLSIIRERNALAHELHDSLAQTLASLRFQVRMLDETLESSGAEPRVRGELLRLKNGLDEAHTELRELLYNFRAPVDQRGLLPGLEKMVDRFRQETGTQIFFQSRCLQVNLDANVEMQLLRIVQECLVNIRKHAQAHTVRVLLSCRQEHDYMLLVEDDGVGFDRMPNGNPGEHIGLSIMEERARKLGARIRIESEPGEGTRVELTYRPGSASLEQNRKKAV